MKFLLFFAVLLLAQQSLVDAGGFGKRTEASESTPSTETVNSWKEKFSWLNFDSSKNKVTCTICTNAVEEKLSVPNDVFSRLSEEVFVKSGFNMWKNAFSAFRDHESSPLHQAAVSLMSRFDEARKGMQKLFKPLNERINMFL